ncbi:MAG: pilus assembly protein PilM, partial [Oscillospiraceae bacterium]
FALTYIRVSMRGEILMAAKVLNIEVGDQLVKVCRAAHKGKEVHISEEFMFPTPPDCVSDGVISDPRTLAIALKSEISLHGLSKITNVVFALSSGKIAIREAKLPTIKDKQLEEIVRTNVDDYFPVDLKNYHFTYSVLEKVGGAQPYSRVLVMAAPLKLIEGYFKLAELADLTVTAIDSSGNSHYQALRGINGKDTCIYIDVDASISFISFISGDKLSLQRTFSYGGDELINHYMRIMNRPAEDYLQALAELDSHSPNFAANEFLSPANIQADLSRLVSSLARSVDYYSSNNQDNAPTRIVLMGACRYLTGLRAMLSEATGLDTVMIDDLHEFTAFTGGIKDAADYISCIGSAIAPLDFMPSQYSTDGKSRKSDSLAAGFVIGGIFVFAALAFCALAFFGYKGAKDDLLATQNEIASLEYTEEVYQTYLAYQKGEEAVKLIFGQKSLPNSQLVAFCEELEAKMPSSILLLSAACTNEGISMNVTVGSYTDAAATIAALRSFETLSVVDVSQVSKEENEAGIARISFTINCSYGKNPYLNGINPYGDLVVPPTPGEGEAGTPTETVEG